MRRTLSRFKLCLLCCAFAQGVGLLSAVQSALPAPSNAASANEGRMDDKPPLRLSKKPAAFSVDLIQNLVNEARTPSQSNASGRETVTGVNCELPQELKERYTTADGVTWLVNSTLLEEVDSNLQMIINCTKEGDVLAFSTTDVVRPSSIIIIPWQLTLSTQVKGTDADDGVYPNRKTKTILNCPHKNSGLFLVKSMNVTFVDLVIEKCTFDGTDAAQAVIEVAACHSQDTYGLVALHRVVFRKNNLTAASGLRMSSSSCSELEMVEVEISENVCSGEACGVHLAKKNRLENCVTFGNKMAETRAPQSSLLFGPASSNTTIQGFALRENMISGVKMQDGSLTVSNASFERNFRDSYISEEIETHCVHLVKSTGRLEECTFVANEGHRGIGIYAKASRISVFSSVFNDNVGYEDGICVYLEDSEAEFKRTSVTGNEAQGQGGFVSALRSRVKLDETRAANNSGTWGGFMRAQDSNVTLERTKSAANTAEYGGFLSALSCIVKLDETQAANNSAKYGGFMRAQDSNVTLGRTKSAANTAEYGGFLSALSCIVKLDETQAAKNSATWGGFMRAQDSNVTLERTKSAANTAEYGGFLSALSCIVKLDETQAANNSAKYGGFMRAQDSNVTLGRTKSAANTAEYGGFLSALSCIVKLDETQAAKNSATWGGFMRAQDSNVTLERTKSAANTAEYGGFLSALSCIVKLDETQAANNSAKYGGFMRAQDSNVTLGRTKSAANTAEYGGFLSALSCIVKLDETQAAKNSATWGGFMRAQDSNVTLERTKSAANTAEYGGFVSAARSRVKLDDTKAVNNSATWGGFIRARRSNVTLGRTKSTANTAEYGGFLSALSCIVKLNDTNATEDSATWGGFMRAQDSNVTFGRTKSTANTAAYGGFMSALSCTVKLDDTKVVGNDAKEGGFMNAQDSNVTLEHTTATANSAQEYGGFMLAMNSTVKLDKTTAYNNHATWGGFLLAKESNVILERTNSTDNSAENGGFVLLLNSMAKLEHTTETANSAQKYGGFMLALSSTVKLDGTIANNNSAEQGGFMNAQKSNATLERTTVKSNRAEKDGGFMFVFKSTVKLGETNATSNSAKQGGFMQVEESNVTLERTTATANSAQKDGGFMFASNSTVKLDEMAAANNSATECGGFMRLANSTVTIERTTTDDSMSKYGSFVWARNSSLHISQSQLLRSSAKIYGGFAVAIEDSSIFIIDSTVKRAKSRNGGAIWLEKSHLRALNLSILHCEADESGGGVYSIGSSTVVCSDCKLNNNLAKRGKGGAIFFEAESEQNLPLQMVQSRVENNVAKTGGGLFFVCGKRKEECLANSTDCPIMALTETQFSSNAASIAGGAVFTGYVEAIRLRCTNVSSDAGLGFYREQEWEDLRQIESVKDICSSWKGNQAEVYGPNIGTYATAAQITFNKTDKSICVSGGESCVIERYWVGTDLPAAKVELLDGLGQRTPRIDRMINANMSSLNNQFLLGSIVRPMENGSYTFRSIRGFIPPGEYNLTVEFDRKAIKAIGITIRVHDCSVGEMVSTAGFCESCSSTTYNFELSATDCHTCPENGNCDSRVITPEDGYWQKTPCSDQLRRCLPTSACEFQGRSENLKTMVKDVSSCAFEEDWIENYTQAQCAEGHTGPLCGSCQEDFGHGLSSKCNRCLKGFLNVAYILLSMACLLGLTAITIHGTISVLRGETAQTHEQSAPSSSAAVIESPRLGTEVEVVGVPASEETLAKWKAVEMFKITLSYVQTTVLLASIDVGWAIPVVIMAAVAELFGGLASEGIRRSVVCLTSKDISLHPTALALVVSVCVIPCAVLLCWIVFWAAKSTRSGSDRLHRYFSKRCLLSAMVIWYVTLVPVLKTALSVFLCVNVHDAADFAEVDATRMYWAVDTGMRCYEGDHWKLLYGLVVAFVCPVYGGLLTLFVVILKSPPQHLAHKRSWSYQTTGFLYRSYRMDRRRYWEVAIILRKAAIAFFVFCAHLFDSGVPITGVAYIIMLAIVAQILAMPFREDFKDLNRMELASLFVSVATTLAATMLKDETYPENLTRELLTVACALLNVITFCVFVFYILKFAAEYLKHVLRERGHQLAPGAGMFRVLAHWISDKTGRLIGKICPTSEDPEIVEQSPGEA